VYFLRVNLKIESAFAKIGKQWIRILIGGVLLGVLIFLCPPLFGEGYSQLNDILHGNPNSFITNSFFISANASPWLMLLGLFGIILLKAVATSVTIGSGGVGGTFGPSLVIGGLSGFFIAALLNQTGFSLPVANFALVGMAGVMAGVMHAPLMATFLIAEITGGYGLFAPLLVTTTITYICVRPFEHHSIYTRKLAKHGDLLTHNKDKSAWQLMDMQKLIETNFVVVRSGDKLRDLITAIEFSRRNIFPVLDNNDKFLGVIVLDDIRKLIFKPEKYDKYEVDELMYPLSEGDCVRITDSMTDVVNKFKISERYNLVVIDNDNNYIGFLSRANTFSAYRHFVSEFSDE
jgi:CIC family chloride channel protein